ncbi:MAG: phosphopantothenoylcysteine decarboxylase [Elusimicrobia bacterium]|nr:phosphopantothenoylcysteine decarboxylase [Elusimicrobiota bacterium]
MGTIGRSGNNYRSGKKSSFPLTRLNPKFRSVLQGKKVLITAGATREYLDPVRFISNASSGKMGLAIARSFRSCGAKVFLVAGQGVPEFLKFPACIVTSARDMLEESQKRFPRSDIFVAAAAVSDYRPESCGRKKISRNRDPISVRLIPNPDVLATVTRKKKNQFCVGFALEDEGHSGLRKARSKMQTKNCDMMVLNTVSSLESDHIDATILFADGSSRSLGKVKKSQCAQEICQSIAHQLNKKSRP